MSYVALEIFFYVNAFWAGKLARNRNDWRAIVALGGGYGWSSVILLLYYGNKWKLLTADGHDYELFTALMVIAVIFIAVAAHFVVRAKEQPRP